MLTGSEHFLSQEGTHEILKALRRDVLDKYDCFTVGETAMVDLTDAKLLSDEARRELDMVFYFDHLEVDRRLARFVPKKFHAAELLRRFTKWQQGLEWNALYLENHDQPRIVSHYGAGGRSAGKAGTGRLFWERSAKLLATLKFTLRGTPFIYQGQEIGMINFDFTGIDQVKDIETHNLNRLLKRFHVPAFLRWNLLRPSSRDNARTPYQWNGEAGAGFCGGSSGEAEGREASGTPWLGINRSHVWLNRESQKDNNDSVLAYYRNMITLRAGSETLKYGTFRPLFAKGPLIAYERLADTADSAGTTETYTVLLNFSGKRVRLPAVPADAASASALPLAGELTVSNTGRTEVPQGALEPWEAVVIRKLLI
jgi:oligo-1,6-glucosidase